MEPVKATQVWLTSWWTYADWCLRADYQAPICKPFWTWASIALLALGALLLVWVAASFISYRMKLAAALRAQAERD